ncbi:hypothetical protein H5410_015969 [Solanum commersonii]|uniref:Uncharacterized protein n=1 Tax=Solanum commersonii TaxID=4109 RepID=A0A9J5ZV69_SOLCO|nr:hypothetical protein H5410_015969 [Solanum commersonii]
MHLYLTYLTRKKSIKFTLWEEFVVHHENTLVERLIDYPVILAKRIQYNNTYGPQISTSHNVT